MTDMDDEAMKAARRIAAHALCGPEKWKPGVKAGMYEDIMRGLADDEPLVRAAYAAIIETQERCAALMQEIAGPLPKGVLNGEVWILHRIAAAIRSGQQFRKDV